MTDLVETLCHWCGAHPCICPRRCPCVCGGWILASRGTPGIIRDAVLRHNLTEQHRRWRESVADSLSRRQIRPRTAGTPVGGVGVQGPIETAVRSRP
jgi:hypothetical protein